MWNLHKLDTSFGYLFLEMILFCGASWLLSTHIVGLSQLSLVPAYKKRQPVKKGRLTAYDAYDR